MSDEKRTIDEQVRKGYIRGLPAAWLRRLARRLGDLPLEDLKEALKDRTKRQRAQKSRSLSGSAKRRARSRKKAQRKQGAKARAGKHSKAPK